eukprot:1021941-Pelagomonas_calceolata.AAC.2
MQSGKQQRRGGRPRCNWVQAGTCHTAHPASQKAPGLGRLAYRMPASAHLQARGEKALLLLACPPAGAFLPLRPLDPLCSMLHHMRCRNMMAKKFPSENPRSSSLPCQEQLFIYWSLLSPCIYVAQGDTAGISWSRGKGLCNTSQHHTPNPTV